MKQITHQGQGVFSVTVTETRTTSFYVVAENFDEAYDTAHELADTINSEWWEIEDDEVHVSYQTVEPNNNNGQVWVGGPEGDWFYWTDLGEH